MNPRELSAEQLRRGCDPQTLPFASTAEAPDLDEIVGQERATRAIDFGIDIRSPGYNIYAMGPAGAGKTSTIMRFLERKAATRPVPADWGYVHNVADPDLPLAVKLPPLGGNRLRDQVNGLLVQVADSLAKTFGGDRYAESRSSIEHEIERQRDELLRGLDDVLHEHKFDLVRTETGLMVVPVGENGQPLTGEQFQALPEEARQSIEAAQPAAEEALERITRQVREIGEAGLLRLLELDKQIVAAVVKPLFDPLLAEYAEWPDVIHYLEGARSHMAEHAEQFKATGKSDAEAAGQEGGPQSGRRPDWGLSGARSPFDRYRLNVLVDHQGVDGAPVVLETNPTYANLIGRVEGRPEFGALVTDFRYIRAGALHRANGGYLVLDARVLLRQPWAWEALKQALGNSRIRMEDMGQQPGVLVATSLTPEPIPLDVKVVLIGDPHSYYTLYAYDEQFEALFKVRADFAVEMERTAENEIRLSQLIRARCTEENLPHFDVSAVARVIEYSARLVDDQRKLTTQFAQVNGIVREAAYWAQREGHPLVIAEDVDRAINERIYRSNQYEERMRELISDGTIMVDTCGAVVGQVNGLAVLTLGDYAFGKPARITAQTYQGRSGVINIEREAKLSGRIHDKGIMILSGFLGGRFAQDKPLNLSASLAFEQSYEGVDGDSASSTELYALLSSLSELPISQSIAVTGSVNQRGEVQAIGGANLKIEGFFDVCRAAPGGLTGEQGVILPAANVPNLMLRHDVVEAVAAGQFHIYPVSSIDEGMEILTGVPCGEPDADGCYPPDSMNGRVDARLRDLATERPKNNGNGNGNHERQAVDKNGEPDEGDGSPDEPTLPGEQPEPIAES